MPKISQSVSFPDNSGLPNGCNNLLSGRNTSKSSRCASKLKVGGLKMEFSDGLGEGGGGLVDIVRVGCEIYTADNVQQLQNIVEKLKREEDAKK